MPWEKQLIDTLGLTLEEYQWYANQVANYRPERDPAYGIVPEVVCTGFETFLVTTIVGAGLSFASSALAPKPKLPKQTDPAQQQSGGDVTGASVNVENRFTNVDGFTSVQPLAKLGESMQMVFANRRNSYGGVRVETKLLWSQLLSQGDGQELLAIFLANGGELASQPDFDGMGIGDSLLRGYQASKLGIYFRNGNSTNRISSANKVKGDLNPRDNSDVFASELKGYTTLEPIFSGVRIPSTMTIFGISEPVRNAQSWRLPSKRVRVVFSPPLFNGTDIAGYYDEAAKAINAVEKSDRERRKNSSLYSARSGVKTASSAGGFNSNSSEFKDFDIAIGDTMVLFVSDGNLPDGSFQELGVADISSKDDNYRQSIDDKIILGETYLVCGVEAVAFAENTAEPWNTQLEKQYTFKALQPGKVRLTGNGIINHLAAETYPSENAIIEKLNPNFGPTVCKLAVAHFTTTRALSQVEIGIKSQVYKRFSGITNFSSIPDESYMADIEKAGGNYTFGTFSDYGVRYSFFRLEVREKGSDTWINLNKQAGAPFCVKGRTPVNQFNYIRIAFPVSSKIQYEVRLRPISGGAYLAYNRPSNNSVCVLDARTGSEIQYTINGFDIKFKGYTQLIDESNATNDVMFFGGKPTVGRVLSITPTEFATNATLTQATFNTTNISGVGTGLTVKIQSSYSQLTKPTGIVVIGLQTRWLHQGLMSPPAPNDASEGDEHEGTVQFTHSSGAYITVKFKLRAVNKNSYGLYGTGYGASTAQGLPSNTDEGWTQSWLWQNLSTYNSSVTIIDYSGYDVDNPTVITALPNGDYLVNKPDGYATPQNNINQAKISVTYGTQQIPIATVTIDKDGAGYKNNDRFTISGIGITCPEFRVTSALPAQGTVIAERFDAIADVYLYDGQEGSHENGPEHQIVYINEQRENVKYNPLTQNYEDYAPAYENMTLLGLQLRSGKEWSSFNNFTYYAKKGSKVRKIIDEGNLTVNSSDPANAVYGASNLYPEILYHLISNSNLMPTTMVDWDGFAEACKVCLANNFYWDGVLAAPVNIRDWGTENAQYFFLDFLVLGGKLSLQPTFPVNKGTDINGYTLSGAYNRLPLISALFTDGNIIEDSLQVSWYPAEQRKAPQILVTLRDEVENGFAETRNILVKRIDAANPNPQVEAIDFTGFCTSADHAIQFAKLLINVRYHVTHTITFKTLPSGLALQPGQYFRVSSQARHVEQFQNGYVLDDGTVVSSSPMADGTYTVYFWRSGMTEVEERSMVIGADGKTTPEFANSVFTQYNNTTSNRLYKAELISYDEEGMVEITGSHVPVETDGKITYLNMDATLFEVQNEQ